MLFERLIVVSALALYACNEVAPTVSPTSTVTPRFEPTATHTPEPTVTPTKTIEPSPTAISEFETFRLSVIDGKEDNITGVIAFDDKNTKIFKLPVAQQRGSIDRHVDPNLVTDMKQLIDMNLPNWKYVLLAEQDGEAGDEFLKLKIGDWAAIIFGDGYFKYFEVYKITTGISDRALDPYSPITLSDAGYKDANDGAHYLYLDNEPPKEKGTELLFQVCTSGTEKLFVWAREVFKQ